MELKKISQFILKRLPLGYYNGSLYKIIIDKQGVAKFELTKEGFKPWILIISREFYQSSLDQLAITNQREVKALLKLNGNDSKTDNAYCVSAITENQTFFNTWKFSKSLANAFFTLPEDLLLAESITENCTISVENEKHVPRLYVASSTQGIYSSIPTVVLNTVSRFCQSCGVSRQLKNSVITSTQLPMSLLNGVVNLSVKQWLTFWRSPQKTNVYNNLKPSLLAGGGVVLTYFTLSSVYLYWQNTQLEHQILDSKAEVSEALNVQDKFTSMQSQIKSLSAVTGEFKTKAIIWKILLPLFKEANFSNISYQEGRMVIRGTTDKATELLVKISNNKSVEDAHFDLPVTTNRSKERFTISFRVEAEALLKESRDSNATNT